MTVRFSYIYRDGGNYKSDGEVFFSGSYSEDELAALEERMRAAMFEGDQFVASQVGVPSVFMWEQGYRPNEDDHGWHEFSVLEQRDCAPTDSRGRTFEQFVADIEKVAGCWDPPEPPEPDDGEDD